VKTIVLAVPAIKGHERGVLQEQKPARLVALDALPDITHGVCERRRVQRENAGSLHEQFTRAVEKPFENRLRRDSLVQQLHR
jgi:hypothetical protein